jgi:8-oxo-dGTP diphosphatase
LKREYPNQPILGVGAVILEDGKIVLVKRGVEPALGKWSIPGGAVELGEAVRDAVKREAKEECGLTIELIDDKPVDIFDNLVMDKNGGLRYHYILLQFLARPTGGFLKSGSDVTDARLVPLNDVANYDLTESFRLFFLKHQNELEKNAGAF